MFAADLPLFLAGPPGDDAVVAGRPLRALFDAAYADVLGVAGIAPALTCASADVAHAVRGSAVVVRGVAYSVVNIQPDGTGVTVLILERT